MGIYTDNGHPERASFKNSKVLGLGRQIGLKFWGAFWLFPPKLLAKMDKVDSKKYILRFF